MMIKFLRHEYKLKLYSLIFCILGSTSIILYVTSTVNLYQFKLFNQGFLMPMFGIWIIGIYKEFYEDNLKELLFCYPLTTYSLGIKKVLYLSLFSLVVILPLAIFDSNIYNSLTLYVSQVSVYICIGFALITLTRSYEFSISIILLYVSTEFLTRGSFIPWPHIIIFDEDLLNQTKHLANEGGVLVIYSLLCLYFGQIFISVDKRN